VASPTLDQSIQNSLTTVSLFLFIGLIYALVVRYRGKVAWREIPSRVGLTPGGLRYYGYGALALLVLIPLIHLMQQASAAGNESSPYLAFQGRGLTPGVITAALIYAFLAAGLGEELLFRGLIAGALGRRMARWKANLLQALIFLLPHLLILLVAPGQWWSLIPFVSLLGLTLGWLRLASGSIGPSILVHGGGNAAVGLFYAAGIY
jgi:membrane protease YdiL (CAAX protease family)